MGKYSGSWESKYHKSHQTTNHTQEIYLEEKKIWRVAASTLARNSMELRKMWGLYRVLGRVGVEFFMVKFYKVEICGVLHPEIGLFILCGGGWIQPLGQLKYYENYVGRTWQL